LKQKAEIAAHTGNFDLAEKYYLEMDRKDLAIDLRVRLGDWFRVVQLIKSGGGASVMGGSGADDAVLEKAWRNIGEYYYDRQRW
jgi:WD repeat-containing protein 35